MYYLKSVQSSRKRDPTQITDERDLEDFATANDICDFAAAVIEAAELHADRIAGRKMTRSQTVAAYLILRREFQIGRAIVDIDGSMIDYNRLILIQNFYADTAAREDPIRARVNGSIYRVGNGERLPPWHRDDAEHLRASHRRRG